MNIQLEPSYFTFVTPAVALFLFSLVPLFMKVFKGNKEPSSFSVLIYSFVGLIVAAGLSVIFPAESSLVFSGALVFDGLSVWSNFLVIIATGFSIVYAREHLETCHKQFSEIVFLIMNAAVGMMIVAWSNDLIITFIGIEIMSLCLYILIALSDEEKLSKEAAFKYFVLGSLGSAIFLFGVAFIYGGSGTTQFSVLKSAAFELISTSPVFLSGVVMTLLGLCFKAGVFPLHSWVPDVYQGSPTPLTTFMSTGVKIVTFVVFLRFFATGFLMPEGSESLLNLMQILAVITMLIGNLCALGQKSFKRMLAYSSLSHTGYILVGIISMGLGGGYAVGASGVLFYSFGYLLMTLGTFGVACLYEAKVGQEIYIEDLKGLGRKNLWVSISLSVLLLSLAGIPPTVGFFGKLFIFSAAVQNGLIWLAIWGVINSVISVYYYLKPIVYMFFSDEECVLSSGSSKQLTEFSVGLMATLVVLIGFMSSNFYEFVTKSVGQLF